MTCFRSILSVSDRIDGSSQHNNSLIGLGTILSGFGLIQSFRIDSIGFLTDFIPFRSILSFLDYSIEHLTMVPVDGRCPPPPPTPLFHRAITSLCNIILHIYYNKSSICGCHHNRNMYLDMTPAAQLPLYQFNQFLLILWFWSIQSVSDQFHYDIGFGLNILSNKIASGYSYRTLIYACTYTASYQHPRRCHLADLTT